MGLFRFLLAISVVLAHSYTFFGYRMLGPELAVHTFFIISGFYMTLILNKKYVGRNGSYKLFITNRFLRIYPLYWTMLFLTTSFALISYLLMPQQQNVIKLFIDTFLPRPNFFWTCIDWILVNTTLLISSDYFRNPTHDPGRLIMLQAWTLQVELLFYLIAPVVVRRNILFILIITVIFSLITFGNLIPNFGPSNWLTPAFFYTAIFFILGILSYHIYQWIEKNKSITRYAPIISLAFLCLALCFGYLATGMSVENIRSYFFLYYFAACATIPFLFFLSKASTWDRKLGELSYPIYVSHFFIYKLIEHSPLSDLNETILCILTIFSTILFSILLVKTIERPIERIRAARVHKHK